MSSTWTQNDEKLSVVSMIKNESPNDDEQHSNHSYTSNGIASLSVPTKAIQLPLNGQSQLSINESICPETAELKNLNIISSNNIQEEQYLSTNRKDRSDNFLLVLFCF